ncbi:NADH-quinone oxidoreductase subunit K [Bosea sp. RAC05]|uniref:NADH-quinone oxidoreductase subunit K n=1 Tax=Bosea sp. RAC05 TaxID=1842539 RepID=UPI00083CEE4F|nr:NADH-quinone oxidoreductase subunit K [Bosea sp. RAC05]AOG07880.1 NADH-ubiquinone/plastoquinone oxidoreductase chain 4L family protein [Bosea sp. RAC05]
MEPVFALAFGVLVAASAYLVMSRNVLRIVLGLLVLGNAANLSIFLAGRMGSRTPPLVPGGAEALVGGANPLPQALILTAIVISFALIAFTVILFESAHRRFHTLDTEELRDAEPKAPTGLPPLPAERPSPAHRATEPAR